MKYIRTKDDRIITKEKFWFENGGIGELIGTKEADTIEELCDEFVFIDKTCEHTHLIYKKQFFRGVYDVHKRAGLNETIYGAIWTDKGLIYVAKMNKKGELELL